METNFNFKSQICTDKVQSERLLALGLKKETADMFWWDNGYGSCAVISRPAEKEDGEYGEVIPAWSLDRLLEIIPENINLPGVGKVYRVVYNGIIAYELDNVRYKTFQGYDRYIRCIECIRWLIKEGYLV